MAQGFAHDLAGVGVSAGSNFMSDEALEVFGQCYLYVRIFPRGPPDVNRDDENYQPGMADDADLLRRVAEEAAQRLLTGPERLPPHQWTLASKRQAEALKVFAGQGFLLQRGDRRHAHPPRRRIRRTREQRQLDRPPAGTGCLGLG